MGKTDIMVSVQCITFNQAKYIRETLEGILMQETNFNFEILIHDDASTDGTAEVLREYEEKYSDLIHVIYEEKNQWSKHIDYNYEVLAPLARGKYIAFCEGDDAWIDNHKLQLQVDYMETHPKCSMTAHKAYLQYPEGWSGKREKRSMGYEKSGIISFKDSFTKWLMATSSFVFRKSLYMEQPDFFRQAPTGDEPLKFYMAHRGEIYYFDRCMSVYNKMGEGAWTTNQLAENWDKQVAYFTGYLDFFEKYNEYTKGKYDNLVRWAQEDRIIKLLNHLLFLDMTAAEMQKAIACLICACPTRWRGYLEKKKTAFQIMNPGCLADSLQKKVGKRKLFIYGAGELAAKMIKLLRETEIQIEGVIVSDKQAKPSHFLGYKMMYFSQYAMLNKHDGFIVIAMNYLPIRSIVFNLEREGIVDYFWPFEQIYHREECDEILY